MFERGGRDRAEGPVSVEIILEDGQELYGQLVMPPGRNLVEVLNSASQFLEFEPTNGNRIFIAKSALRTIMPMNVPEAPDLWAGPTQGGSFDPFSVLGISHGASRAEMREAYVALAKIYHPDRYAASDLPQEVRNYLAVMARRINAAYEALESAQKKATAKQEPVFTRRGHA